jgi:hypothetical protein
VDLARSLRGVGGGGNDSSTARQFKDLQLPGSSLYVYAQQH